MENPMTTPLPTLYATNCQIAFNDNGYKILNRLLYENRYSSIFLITDSNSHAFCGPAFLSELETDLRIEIIEIDPGEENKAIETCSGIWETLAELEADRKSLVINLGGGVVTDLGGFVASAFKRGIDFLNVPTTLLAMVDASVGGKNGVNLGSLKNQIGTIINPKMVLIDTRFLETLPQKEFLSGYAEMLKHGLIADRAYWNILKDREDPQNDIGKLIHWSVEIKSEIVMRDPDENGIRKALNFGHTLGHAIESHFMESAKLLHGEAIAAGMVLESFISKEKGHLSADDYSDIKKNVKMRYADIIFEENDVKAILELLRHDKKNEYGKVNFTLLNGIGSVEIDQSADNELIFSAFSNYNV